MPELPEVETAVRLLKTALVGERFRSVELHWANMLPGLGVAELQTTIRGQAIADVRRRGKYLIFELSRGQSLVLHLRMSGLLLLDDQAGTRTVHVRASFRFASGRTLSFVDPRKFGRIYLVSDWAEITAHLGPEPLDPGFTPENLLAGLSRTKSPIKPALLGQRLVAGLGNIYVDECLWCAAIHPLEPCAEITAHQALLLHGCLRKILREAIELRGTSIGDNVVPDGSYQPKVYGRHGEPCLRCGTLISRIVVTQRGTHLCPVCQKLAPRRRRIPRIKRAVR